MNRGDDMMTLRSARKGPVVLAWAAVLSLTEAPIGRAEVQLRSYRSVTIGEITSERMPGQELVETSGDLRWSGNELLLNPNHISAVWPLLIELTALPPKELARIQTRCSALRGRPGCRAKIRGEVTLVRNRRSLIAHDIEVQSSAPQN
jgi:hypothetical protein